MPETAVQQETPAELETSSAADIVLGIASYNSAETVGEVVRAAQSGLATYFPGSRWILVNADGGSKDGTPSVAMESAVDKTNFVQVTYPVYPVHKLSLEYHGVPGKTSALQAIFGVASDRGARVCAVIDSNIRSVTPDWMDALVRPVMEGGFDFVSPVYLRNKYEATILTGIVYPLVRALYGKRIQQPTGGDFAFSGKLVNHLLGQPQLDSDAAGSGADAWITTEAACGGFRLAQTCLGPRVFGQSDPVPEVSSLISQTVGAIFTEMERTPSIWQRIRGSQQVPISGSCGEPDSEPPPVDTAPMIQAFRLGYQNLQDIWRMVLPPATLMELKRLYVTDSFQFNDAIWARVVYDFALRWRMRIIDRDHLLRALTPLYLGWVASYVRAVRDANLKEAQDRIEKLCLAFETQKNYLISQWRWPDRFSP